jgi:hypothetical protein
MWTVLVVLAGCTGTDHASPSAEATRPSSSSTSSAPPDPVVCDGTDEFNQDDDGAVQALLAPSQLDGGDWTSAELPPCPWALSAEELLAVPECRAAAASAGAPANDEARNGNARVAYMRADGIQIDDRIEIYTSRQNVDAIRAILVSPSLPTCYSRALQRHAADDHESTVDHVCVGSFDVQPDAAALGLGFPATEDYAADPGFVNGVDVDFTTTHDGSSEPIAMRVVTFGTGGLMSTLTVIGPTAADVEAVDVSSVLGEAARSFTELFSGGS